MTCKDCIHYDICKDADNTEYADMEHLKGDCPRFKSATDVAPKTEIASEIFADIQEDCFDQFGYFDYDAFAQIKKKYIGVSANEQ